MFQCYIFLCILYLYKGFACYHNSLHAGVVPINGARVQEDLFIECNTKWTGVSPIGKKPNFVFGFLLSRKYFEPITVALFTIDFGFNQIKSRIRSFRIHYISCERVGN